MTLRREPATLNSGGMSNRENGPLARQSSGPHHYEVCRCVRMIVDQHAPCSALPVGGPSIRAGISELCKVNANIWRQREPAFSGIELAILAELGRRPESLP
jgi:hypothetical protein